MPCLYQSFNIEKTFFLFFVATIVPARALFLAIGAIYQEIILTFATSWAL